MGSIKIKGPQVLNGRVKISGSKNAALPILVASIMCDGTTIIDNIPNLTDIKTSIRLLEALGVTAEFFEAERCVKLISTNDLRHVAPYELITSMRASFFVAGPLLAKAKLAKIPLPGGCAIGSRPIDIHLKGFEALGANVRIEHGFVILRADQLIGTDMTLDFPSVGATENIMMAACLAKGQTVIRNAAKEPEIDDLAAFLVASGAKISGTGTDVIIIDGVETLKGIKHRVIPDRVEAATMIIAAAMSKGSVLVEEVNLSHLTAIINVLELAGVKMICKDSSVLVESSNDFNAVDIDTAPYPGFPTDVQAQLMAFLAVAKGTSVISENIFENRFMHAPELNRMGANIKVDGQKAVIIGVEKLSAAPVQVTDLRAGGAMWIAANVADGVSKLFETQHVYRGYDNLRGKMESLGAVFIDD
jgi:UDP-N-acetylglucosamine 1-carboxyvinyltransferase